MYFKYTLKYFHYGENYDAFESKGIVYALNMGKAAMMVIQDYQEDNIEFESLKLVPLTDKTELVYEKKRKLQED